MQSGIVSCGTRTARDRVSLSSSRTVAFAGSSTMSSMARRRVCRIGKKDVYFDRSAMNDCIKALNLEESDAICPICLPNSWY